MLTRHNDAIPGANAKMKNTMSRRTTALLVIMAVLISWKTLSENTRKEHAESAETLLPLEYAFNDPAAMELIVAEDNPIKDDNRSMDSFFEKLAALKLGSRERVSIVHIGDSHIQAGFMTNSTRRLLQATFGNGGRGLVAPLKLGGTNEPTDYSITSTNSWEMTGRCTAKEKNLPTGITGMSIGCEESLVNFTITSNEPFSTVRVFHHEKAPLLVLPDNVDADMSCPGTTDSETSTTLLLDSEVNSLRLEGTVSREYNTNIFYGFSLENDQAGILYHSIGLNGATYEHYNNYPDFAQSTAMLEPDLIIISLGVNDTTGGNYRNDYFSNRIDELVSALRAANPGAAILLTTPAESCLRRRRALNVNPNVDNAARTIKEYCREKGIACWDMYSATGGSGSNAKWHKAGYFSADKLHMTREGYAIAGELLYDAIITGYNDYIAQYAQRRI